MSLLNKIYEKQYNKENTDTRVTELQTWIAQLKHHNDAKNEFVKKNRHRTQYTEVKTQYISIFQTQSRFELLFEILKAQQELINSLRENGK